MRRSRRAGSKEPILTRSPEVWNAQVQEEGVPGVRPVETPEGTVDGLEVWMEFEEDTEPDRSAAADAAFRWFDAESDGMSSDRISHETASNSKERINKDPVLPKGIYKGTDMLINDNKSCRLCCLTGKTTDGIVDGLYTEAYPALSSGPSARPTLS